MSPPRPEILLGAPLVPLTRSGALALAADAIRARRRVSLVFANVHLVMESVRAVPVRRALWAATAVLPDGMPLVWFLRARGHASQDRVYGPGFTADLLALAARDRRRVYFHGSTPGVLAALAAALRRRYPRLRLAGLDAPAFRAGPDAAAERAAARRINAARPDIVFVGLGAPKQELWLARNRARLHAPVVAAVGAAFDFLAGTKPQAPGWMQRAGLEWLFRLATEPRRLAWRYGALNPAYLVLLALQAAGWRGPRRPGR